MLHSTADAARKIGCDPATVRRACDKHGIGQQISGAWVLTAEEIERLRQIVRKSPGNPKFVAGNYFGGAKKRPKRIRKK